MSVSAPLSRPIVGPAAFTQFVVVAGLASLLLGTLSMRATAALPREGTEISEAKLSGPGVQSGRMSWFGQYGYGRYNDGLHRHVWRDSGDNGINASGLPQMVPGIALMDQRTLGHWFEVELNGRVFLVRQVDVGPHPRTGRKIDINAPLSDMAGFAPTNFPTDRIAKWRYVGSPQTMLAMRERPAAPKLKQLALLETWDYGMTDQPRLAYDLVSPNLSAYAPMLTRASATTAPWLAAAPKTVDLLRSPRHWASIDKSSRRDLEATLAETKPQMLPGELPEPVILAGPPPALVASAAAVRVAAVVSVPPAVKVTPPQRIGRASPRGPRPTYARATFEDQLFRPVLRILGLW